MAVLVEWQHIYRRNYAGNSYNNLACAFLYAILLALLMILQFYYELILTIVSVQYISHCNVHVNEEIEWRDACLKHLIFDRNGCFIAIDDCVKFHDVHAVIDARVMQIKRVFRANKWDAYVLIELRHSDPDVQVIRAVDSSKLEVTIGVRDQ